MKRRILFAKSAILAVVAIAGIAGATNAVAQQAPNFDAEAFRRAQEEFNKVPNTSGDGPYPATIETDPGLPGHVVYRPADLSAFPSRDTLPVMAGIPATPSCVKSARKSAAEPGGPSCSRRSAYCRG